MPSHAAVDVGKALFPLFALALDLPENYFDDKVRPSHRATHFR
jgi:isopenicillin N synthase-like dioxygenase